MAGARRLRGIAWCALLGGAVAGRALSHRREWSDPQGWEPLQVAEGLAAGHGFAWEREHRWLFWDDPRRGFFPTAWAEPVYPLILAFDLRVFGPDRGKRAAILFQVGCVLLTAVLTYLVGRRWFGEASGVLASLALLLAPELAGVSYPYLQSAPVAGLAVMAALWVFLWAAEAPSWRRAVLLGGVLGAAVMTCAPTLAFVPFVAAALLLAGGRRDWRRAIGRTAACALGLVVVCGPWSVRNYVVFRAFVPVRDGLGQIAFSGYPVLAERFVPGYRACGVAGGPSWTARSALGAVRHTQLDNEDRNALDVRGFECVSREPPAGYAAMNEPQRDREYFRRALEFVRTHPRVAAKLALAKAAVFFLLGWSRYLRVLTILALAGAVLLVRRRAGLAAMLAIASFSSAYVVGTPYFYRYRYPVEPLIALLASWLVAQLLLVIGRSSGLASAFPDHPTPHPG